MKASYIAIYDDGHVTIEDTSNEEASSDSMTEEVPDDFFTAGEQGRTAAPRELSFSSGQSFYVPWNQSSMTMVTDYLRIGIGVIVVIGILVFVFKYGIDFVVGIFNAFMRAWKS